jgi:hypothetical protein
MSKKRQPKKGEFDDFPIIPMAFRDMPEKRKEMEKLKDRIVEDMAELFKHLDEFSRSTLGFSIIILALSRRKELDDEEKEKK